MAKKLYNQIVNKFIAWLTKEPPPDEIPPCDFDRIKYELRQGDVLLFEGRSRVSNIIRTITQSPWTHAALYIGSLHDIEDHELRKKVAINLKKRENVRLVLESELGKGVVVTPLSNYRHHHIRICRPIGITPNDVALVIAYTVKHLGQAYSVRKLLDLARFLLPWSILPRRWGSSLFWTSSGKPKSGICSSLVAEAFTFVKFPILPFIVKKEEENSFEVVHRNPHLFAPKDFDYSPYFEIIKYPIFDPHEPLPYYRRLPWAKEGVLHQDSGILTSPKKQAEQDKSIDILPDTQKKDSKKISDEDDNIDKPETD
jgi:hypothetical protein